MTAPFDGYLAHRSLCQYLGCPVLALIQQLLLQEVPALLSLPQGNIGMPIWLIMTGITTGIQGYNRLISKIVPLTAAARSIDLIPFMVVSHHPVILCMQRYIPPWKVCCGCAVSPTLMGAW